MNTSNPIGRAFSRLIKWIGAIPRAIHRISQRKQQRLAQKEFEIERLDRIRNPFKYRGK
jgi:hypothetical protein